MKKAGKVWIVGAGPGAPDLITRRGWDAMLFADLILTDALVHPGATTWARKARIIDVGRRGGNAEARQRRINRLMITAARAGKQVVRLKGGDPFVFGRGGEECEALLKARVPFEVVPGVSSAIAAPAAAGIPLTHRNHASSFAVITGYETRKHGDEVQWELLAHAVDTLVVLMGAARMEDLVTRLLRAGRDPDTPVAAVRWGTWPIQTIRRATLGTAVAKLAGLRPPAALVIGPTAGLRLTIPERSGTLAGVRIAVTGSASVIHDQRVLEQPGGMVSSIPVIRQQTLPVSDDIKQWWGSLDWIIFTSQHAVRLFRDVLLTKKLGWRSQPRCRIAAIGKETAFEVAFWLGEQPDVIARRANAEGLLTELPLVKGKRILIPRAQVARETLPEGLRRQGAKVNVLRLYKVVPESNGLAHLKDLVRGGRVDVITFASGSAVEHVMRALGTAGRKRLRSVLLASIGPVTTAALKKWKFAPAIRAPQASMEALAGAIVRYYRKHPRAPRLR